MLRVLLRCSKTLFELPRENDIVQESGIGGEELEAICNVELRDGVYHILDTVGRPPRIVIFDSQPSKGKGDKIPTHRTAKLRTKS